MDLDLTRFGSDTDEQSSDTPSVFTTVAGLIANGGPKMVFQPIIHVETKRLLGAEALSRFPSALGTQLWFELAASVGLIAELETCAARNALELGDASTRAALGWEIIGINISPKTLLDHRFDELLAEHLGQHVVLELSDPRERTDWPLVRRYIDRARDLGCRIAMNSMTCDPVAQFERLLAVEPDIIKLDTGYTSTLVTNHRRHRGAAEDFLRKCVQRGVFVVAVGVEHESDVEALLELGIEAAQGYAFGRPQPIKSFRPAETVLGLADIISGAGWS